MPAAPPAALSGELGGGDKGAAAAVFGAALVASDGAAEALGGFADPKGGSAPTESCAQPSSSATPMQAAAARRAKLGRPLTMHSARSVIHERRACTAPFGLRRAAHQHP
jgi:hypothetical protein